MKVTLRHNWYQFINTFATDSFHVFYGKVGNVLPHYITKCNWIFKNSDLIQNIPRIHSQTDTKKISFLNYDGERIEK